MGAFWRISQLFFMFSGSVVYVLLLGNVRLNYIDVINEKKPDHTLESCLPSDANITLLPAYDDPHTKEIRKTMLRHKVPPYLISFGGSGNTFTRLVIEYISKIYTGSIYPHEFQLSGFVGSNFCGTEGIVTKFHGEHIRKKLLEGILNGKCLCGCTINRSTNQSQYNVSLEAFQRIHGNFTPAAIFLLRDPWRSMFALWNYWSGKFIRGKEARHQAHIAMRHNMSDFVNKWNIEKYAGKWITNVLIWNKFKKRNVSQIAVSFENITHRNKSIAMYEILKMIKYLYNESYYAENVLLFKRRIECMWNISETDKRMTAIHRSKPNINQLNISYAYELIGGERICKLWKRLKPFATQFGYSIYNNISCSNII